MTPLSRLYLVGILIFLFAQSEVLRRTGKGSSILAILLLISIAAFIFDDGGKP